MIFNAISVDSSLASTAISSVVGLFIIYIVTYLTYALFLHPLRGYPGPKLSAISRIPYWIACLKGDQVRWMHRLHNEYGSVVRFGPGDLSYTDGRAWKDICGVQKGRKENGKDVKFHTTPTNGIPNIIAHPDQAGHARTRRVFAPAFSEKALKQQESLFKKYAHLMVAKAYESNEAGEKPVDMTQLFNFATFDIMADLAFGQPLGLLEKAEYTPWVAAVFQTVRVLPFIQMIEFYPFLKRVFDLIQPRFVAEMRHSHFRHTVDRVNERLREGSDRPDIWNLAIDSDALSLGEMHVNAELFMTAGTETTASLLSGLTYYLVTNEDKLKRLTDEIRAQFGTGDDIALEPLAGLEYLNACIREGLRVYPPIPSSIPRIIPQGGNIVLGTWVPAGTRVSVHHTATYRSAGNFRNPDTFAPERWLDDAQYKDDKREAHQPFSVGPRNCLGMNMAWHEMRLILAKLLFHFDIESDVGPEWTDQKVYVIWHRKPLMCRLKPVVGKLSV